MEPDQDLGIQWLPSPHGPEPQWRRELSPSRSHSAGTESCATGENTPAVSKKKEQRHGFQNAVLSLFEPGNDRHTTTPSAPMTKIGGDDEEIGLVLKVRRQNLGKMPRLHRGDVAHHHRNDCDI